MNHRRDYKKSSLFTGERVARIAFQRTIVSMKGEPGLPGKMSVITVHAPWESIVVKEIAAARQLLNRSGGREDRPLISVPAADAEAVSRLHPISSGSTKRSVTLRSVALIPITVSALMKPLKIVLRIVSNGRITD